MTTAYSLSGLDTFTTAYIEAALWSSTIDPFGECPECGRERQVLCRWNEQREHVCEHCSDREPNYEPPADDNYDPSDIAPETLAEMVSDCRDFQESFGERIASNLARAGHDFWLTRNRHGAGFWDGDWENDGEFLTQMSHPYGEVCLYVGDDGLIHS